MEVEIFNPPPNMIKMRCRVCETEQWRWKGKAWRARHQCFHCGANPLEVCRGPGSKGPIASPIERAKKDRPPRRNWADENRPEIPDEGLHRWDRSTRDMDGLGGSVPRKLF